MFISPMLLETAPKPYSHNERDDPDYDEYLNLGTENVITNDTSNLHYASR